VQDQYVGDVGDFGKYGLLRWLCGMTCADGGPALSLGVVWYRVPNEGGKDGKNLGYLDAPPKNRDWQRFRQCDEQLYDTLFDIVYDGLYPVLQRERRNVQSVQEEGRVFPPGTAFYPDRLTFDGMPVIGAAAREERVRHRDKWTEGAVLKTDGRDVVFVDPDNGIQVPSAEPHHTRGPKYVFFSELKRLTATPHPPSLVIYQHMNHREKVDRQIRRRLEEIGARLDGHASPVALQFRTSRFFFVVPTKAHRSVLLDRARCLARIPWDGHFKLVRLETP
jgi:hypothetical protein